MGEFSNEQHRYLRKEDDVDPEWVELIAEALRMGITKEEIRNLLQSNGRLENNHHVIKSYKVSGI